MQPLLLMAPLIAGEGVMGADEPAYCSRTMIYVVGEHHAFALMPLSHTPPTEMTPPGCTVKLSTAPVETSRQ